MKANGHTLGKNQSSYNTFDFAKLGAQNAAHQSPTKALRKFELLAFVTNKKMSRAVRIAAITFLDDIDLLLDVATGNAPTFIRKDALIQIDTLCSKVSLKKPQVEKLLPCLNEKDLIAFTIVILDMHDYDWGASSNEETVRALCLALQECNCIHEQVILEDAFAYLANNRRDLNAFLYANSPQGFLADTMYAPLNITNALLLDFTQESNVA